VITLPYLIGGRKVGYISSQVVPRLNIFLLRDPLEKFQQCQGQFGLRLAGP
jgi:hypothetical protein